MDLSLKGKLALITGSTRGIGLASAKGLAEMGAEVVINGRSQESVDKAIADVKVVAPNAEVRGVVADLSDAAGCDALIKALPKADILVNNMGIYGPKAFFETTDDEWREMFDVNVMSGVRMTRHYLKGMLEESDWGRVVFVSSESGIFVPTEMVHYGFSKGAQLVIARGAAQLTKGTNVTVNSVLPGPTWVEAQTGRMTARAEAQGITLDEIKAKTFTERRPASLIQRYATPEEVANMICYVCSPAASATNGAALRVEGGIVTNPF